MDVICIDSNILSADGGFCRPKNEKNEIEFFSPFNKFKFKMLTQ